MDTEKKEKTRTGIFVSGFRWSGSSAVSDWLECFSAIRKPPDSEPANDEIRALNYGLTLFIRAAEKPLFYGEKLARFTMWPDRKMWKHVFGKPFACERGILSLPILGLDELFMAAASGRLNPGIDTYEKLLCSNLCTSDFRKDRVYLEKLKELTDAAREMIRKSPSSWQDIKEDKRFTLAVSRFLALFHDRLSSGGTVPVFDNAFSGLTPRFFDLIESSVFGKQLVIFVIRDPRDQFAEQVRFSTKTFPFMAGKFASSYRKLVKGALDYEASCSGMPDKAVKVISFEDFVLDRNDTRSSLKLFIGKILDDAGIPYNFDSGKYDPHRSGKNIGIWKKSAISRQLSLIGKKLPEYLWSGN